MKTKIAAGAEIDTLTRAELEQVMQSWRNELTRGARFRRHAIRGTVDAAGNLMMGGPEDGPNESLAWAVTRLSIAPGPTIPAGGLQVYVNDAGNSTLLLRSLVTDLFPGDHGCVLATGDALRIGGSALTVGDNIWVTLSIKEVPIQQVWQL